MREVGGAFEIHRENGEGGALEILWAGHLRSGQSDVVRRYLLFPKIPNILESRHLYWCITFSFSEVLNFFTQVLAWSFTCQRKRKEILKSERDIWWTNVREREKGTLWRFAVEDGGRYHVFAVGKAFDKRVWRVLVFIEKDHQWVSDWQQASLPLHIKYKTHRDSEGDFVFTLTLSDGHCCWCLELMVALLCISGLTLSSSAEFLKRTHASTQSPSSHCLSDNQFIQFPFK